MPTSMRKIVLASASPRRKELLEQLGLKFEVDPASDAENISQDLPPQELAVAVSVSKASAVAGRHKNSIIIAADTFGVLRGKIIGKPQTEAGARKMLKRLSGKVHSVITGFTVLDTGSGRIVTRSVETKVRIKKLTDEEIDAYVRTGEPLDKAGAYAIQGLGSVIVDGIEGDYYNVVGLPLAALADSLREFGVRIVDSKGEA